MKITNALKAGYGSASAGDVIISNLIIVYGLYFLTEVEGMKAVPASNIIFAATMLCTISIGIIGYISDRHPISGRKRVPYMLISVVPMTVCLILSSIRPDQTFLIISNQIHTICFLKCL